VAGWEWLAWLASLVAGWLWCGFLEFIGLAQPPES